DNITTLCNLRRGKIVESFAGNRRNFVMSKRIHVVPHGDGLGARREGASRVGPVDDAQAGAGDAGRTTALREHGEVSIRRPDGRIRDSDSYGNDPFPPKG